MPKNRDSLAPSQAVGPWYPAIVSNLSQVAACSLVCLASWWGLLPEPNLLAQEPPGQVATTEIDPAIAAGVSLPEDLAEWKAKDFSLALKSNSSRFPKALKSLLRRSKTPQQMAAALQIMLEVLTPEKEPTLDPGQQVVSAVNPDGTVPTAPFEAETIDLIRSIASLKTAGAKQALLKIIAGQQKTRVSERKALQEAFRLLSTLTFEGSDPLNNLVDLYLQSEKLRPPVEAPVASDPNAPQGFNLPPVEEPITSDELKALAIGALAGLSDSESRLRLVPVVLKESGQDLLSLLLTTDPANLPAQVKLLESKELSNENRKQIEGLFSEMSGQALAALLGLSPSFASTEADETDSPAEVAAGGTDNRPSAEPDLDGDPFNSPGSETTEGETQTGKGYGLSQEDAIASAALLWPGRFGVKAEEQANSLSLAKAKASSLLMAGKVPTPNVREAVTAGLVKRGEKADEFVLSTGLYSSEIADPGYYPVIKWLVRNKKPPKPRRRDGEGETQQPGPGNPNESEEVPVPAVKELFDRMVLLMETGKSRKKGATTGMPFKFPAAAKISHSVLAELKPTDVPGVNLAPVKVYYVTLTQFESTRNLKLQYMRQTGKPVRQTVVGNALWLDKVEFPMDTPIMRSIDVLISPAGNTDDSGGSSRAGGPQVSGDEELSEDRIKGNYEIKVLIVEIPKPASIAATQSKPASASK